MNPITLPETISQAAVFLAMPVKSFFPFTIVNSARKSAPTIPLAQAITADGRGIKRLNIPIEPNISIDAASMVSDFGEFLSVVSIILLDFCLLRVICECVP